jgi:hypothetical protein
MTQRNALSHQYVRPRLISNYLFKSRFSRDWHAENGKVLALQLCASNQLNYYFGQGTKSGSDSSWLILFQRTFFLQLSKRRCNKCIINTDLIHQNFLTQKCTGWYISGHFYSSICLLVSCKIVYMSLFVDVKREFICRSGMWVWILHAQWNRIS